jgi:ArsR family transcriptional regulator, arsenate/arsenite/antimonite-responsive transcriptional repressor
MWHTRVMNTTTKPTRVIVPQVAPYAPSKEMGEHAQVLKALAEPMRLSILSIIASRNGEAVCACDFPDALGISQPTASHHLKRLTDAGLLTREQRGKWAWFSLVPGSLDGVHGFLKQLS